MGRRHQQRGTVGKNKHWQKEIVVQWEGLFRKITELLQQNWIFILKTMFPQKLSDMSFTNPTSMVGLQLLNVWLLKVMLRCVNNGVTSIKPGHQTNGNANVISSDESSFTLLYLENSQGNLQFRMPGSNREIWGRFCDGLGSNIVAFCWSHC
jgi:hypothetical protein